MNLKSGSGTPKPSKTIKRLIQRFCEVRPFEKTTFSRPLGAAARRIFPSHLGF